MLSCIDETARQSMEVKPRGKRVRDVERYIFVWITAARKRFIDYSIDSKLLSTFLLSLFRNLFQTGSRFKTKTKAKRKISTRETRRRKITIPETGLASLVRLFNTTNPHYIIQQAFHFFLRCRVAEDPNNSQNFIFFIKNAGQMPS